MAAEGIISQYPGPGLLKKQATVSAEGIILQYHGPGTLDKQATGRLKVSFQKIVALGCSGSS